MTAVLKPGMFPLAQREIVVALRRRRVLVTQLITLVITGVTAVGVAAVNHVFGDPVQMGALPFGRDVLVAGLGALCAMMGFVIPALTATSISEERERRTLDLLLCTRMRPADLVAGKLVGGLVQGVLVVSASLPVAAFAWLYGGVTLAHLVVAYVLVLMLMVLLLASGMFASARATASKMAISSTYGVNVLMMSMLGVPGLLATGVSYVGGTVDVELAVWLVVVALVVAWLSAGSFLGSVTGISPASRDPAPPARKLLLAISGSAILAALPLSFAGDEKWARTPFAVLLGVLLVMFAVACVLFATEEFPPPTSSPSPLWWRGSPWVGPLFAMVCAVVVALVVPPVLLRKLAAPPITLATCLAMVPLLASVAGLASLTRVIPHRRAARNVLAFGALVLLGVVTPLVAFFAGHTSLETAPAGMMLWLHPVVVLMAVAPSATDAATGAAAVSGPFGLPLLVAFVVGHVVLAAVGFTVSAVWGKPAIRMD